MLCLADSHILTVQALHNMYNPCWNRCIFLILHIDRIAGYDLWDVKIVESLLSFQAIKAVQFEKSEPQVSWKLQCQPLMSMFIRCWTVRFVDRHSKVVWETMGPGGLFGSFNQCKCPQNNWQWEMLLGKVWIFLQLFKRLHHNVGRQKSKGWYHTNPTGKFMVILVVHFQFLILNYSPNWLW